MGSVYSAGDGTDGALGLGVRDSSDAFRLVEWWVEKPSLDRLVAQQTVAFFRVLTRLDSIPYIYEPSKDCLRLFVWWYVHIEEYIQTLSSLFLWGGCLEARFSAKKQAAGSVE